MPYRPPIHRPAGSRRAKRAKQQQYNRTPARRAHQRLYDHQWREYSRNRLALYPWCVHCLERGRGLVLATVTDHIVPHCGDPVLFLEPTNHQSLCKPCHDTKTATEDGGFGSE